MCYSYTISLWLTKFFPNLTFSESPLTTFPKPGKSILLFLIIILFIGIFLVLRKSVLIKRIVLVFAAGFIGMTIEIILILLYQNKNGILFRDIGLLIMAFMVGLSLGSYLINKIITIIKDRIKIQDWIGGLLFVGFSILILIVYFFIKVDFMNSLWIIFFILLLVGMFVSGIFAFASLYKVTNQQIVITQLYTADLIGGCLGSLVASLLLVPIYGFFFSLLLMIIVSLISVLYSIP